jgi:hypothetical protein
MKDSSILIIGGLALGAAFLFKGQQQKSASTQTGTSSLLDAIFGKRSQAPNGINGNPFVYGFNSQPQAKSNQTAEIVNASANVLGAIGKIWGSYKGSPAKVNAPSTPAKTFDSNDDLVLPNAYPDYVTGPDDVTYVRTGDSYTAIE